MVEPSVGIAQTAVTRSLPDTDGHIDVMGDAAELAHDFRADIHRVFAGHMTHGAHRFRFATW